MVHAREPGTGMDPTSKRTSGAGSEVDQKVSAHAFYGEYHGHCVEHLRAVQGELRRNGRSLVFLCGDSTLDNKYWLPGIATSRALNGFERALEPAVMQQDVAYWVNHALVERGLGGHAACLNCSVEESTLSDRSGGTLLPQDEFIRDNMHEGDILVVSCAGNDIALRPTVKTILSMVALMMSPRALIESGWAPGMRHLLDLFGGRTRELCQRLISKCPGKGPRAVVVCMLYYLDENPTPSWAARTLSALGYDTDPTKLQLLIRKAYELATSRIELPGVNVVPVPLYEALDGKDAKDYVQRVEPSSSGGRKMASALLDRISSMLTPGVVSSSETKW